MAGSRTIELINQETAAIFAAAKADGDRELNDEELTQYAELQAEQIRVGNSLRAKQSFAAQQAVSAPAVITGTPSTGADAEDAAFAHYLRTGIPNADLTFAQTEGSPSGGGYNVPDGFLNRLIEARTAFGGFMNEAENITTATGNDIHYPTVPTAALYSSADIAIETAVTAAGADIVFGEVILGAYRYTAAGTGNLPLKVTVELLQDSIFDIGAFVARRLGERIARKQAYDLINGSGSGEPQGIAYGTAGTVEHDPDGFAAFSNIVHALDPVYRPRAKWIMNDATAAIIEQLLDGASGTSGRPILTSAVQGIESPSNNYRLLGYPVIIDQAMPTWAADNVIGAGFGDWKEAYIVRHVKDLQVMVNPYAATGYVVYDAWARMDGKVQNASAYVTGEGT